MNILKINKEIQGVVFLFYFHVNAFLEEAFVFKISLDFFFYSLLE